MIRKTFLLVALTLLACSSYKTNAQGREVTTLQTGWKFVLGKSETAYQVDFDDSKWENVSVPHDWGVAGNFIVEGDGNTGKLPWKGEGWYRLDLPIPATYTGKRIYLVFDGVMASPQIYVNGKLAGTWDYGYNSFYLDVTEFINFNGKNKLAVHADTREHGSRWYPGAGVYRKVQLAAVDPIHVGMWGTQVTTPVVKPQYTDVRIMTSVFNKSGNAEENVKVENIIINTAGVEVAKSEVITKIPAGKSKDVESTIGLTDPKRWDIGSPNLYKVKTVISKGSTVTDTYYTSFGIRALRFTADNGLYLNDKRVQLKGVNLHHDQGPLGAAFYPRAMERQLEIMKSMGCNAIRTSHNPPAPELLELCDKMGMLVFDEAFDKYDARADIHDATDFEEFAQRNIRNFVMRDRNHPSIFIWSVGNEMWDVQTNSNNGFQRLQTMVNYVRKYDPTRLVTMVSDAQGSAALRHFDYYDVHSWNYGHRYSLARQMEPGKSVIISESSSTVSTRGFYELPLPKNKSEFTTSLQVSSYDLNAPEWADLPDEDFMWQQEEEYVSGEFVWTGFDYLGEPTPYTNSWAKEHGKTDKDASRSSYFGIVDLCGIPKDRFYLYKSYWKPEETTVHILPHWNWQGAKADKMPVFVYTNGDCAELFLNGRSLGKKCKNPTSKNPIERFRLMWMDVAYQPGELKAVAYKEGTEIGKNTLKTAGDPYKIKLTPDRSTITADGMDLSYILVEAYDKNGVICPLANNKINISITGPGFIAGVGNGNAQSFEPFQAKDISLFYGKAMIIIKSDHTKGDVKINAASTGLVNGSAIVKTE